MNRNRLTPYALILLTVLAGGWRTAVAATGQLQLTVVDKDTGQPIACRMHLVGPKTQPFRPAKTPYWHDHFVVPGKILLKLPVGGYTFALERGPEYLNQTGHFKIDYFADDSKRIEMQRAVDMAAEGWWSGDLDVRRPAADIELLMAADDLHVAEVIAWRNNKVSWGKRPPSRPVVAFEGNRFAGLTAGALARPDTEVLLFNLPTSVNLPAGDGKHLPLVTLLADLADARGKGNAWIDVSRPFWWDLPTLVALGQVDSIEVAHGQICRETVLPTEGGGRPRDQVRYPRPWGNARWSQHIYFQLLECGLRIPPGAGSGSGETPNPVGYNRVYVHVEGPLTYEKWWEGFHAGQVVVTNGPLLRPLVNGELPGHVFRAAKGERLDLEIGLTLSTSTAAKIRYLEIVKNGKVEHSAPFEEYSKSGSLPRLQFTESGWFLIRAVIELPKTYRFAITGPYYVEIGDQRRVSRSAAQFFVDWVAQRTRQIQPADPNQQAEAPPWQRRASDYWQDVLSKANAE
jgi:hypothetical protein